MIVEGHAVRRVVAPDIPRVQALFALDPEYWRVVEGAPLRDTEGALVLDERPPGVTLEQKHAWLVDDVVLLDMLEGYPDAQTWFLGLIFIAPAARGRGLGTAVMRGMIDHVRAQGARALRLAVAVQHPAPRRLYERLGFRVIDRRRRTIHTGDVIELDLMELRLHEP